MEKEKIYFKKTLQLIILILFIIAALVIYIDPFQQFRINKYANRDITKQRILNSGIAKNADYELAILGTSVSENFLKKDLEDSFKLKSINLALSGSTNYEQRRMLKLILNKKKVKAIIYGLDVFSYNRNITEERSPVGEFTYSNNPYSKLTYIYNLDVLIGLKNGIENSSNNWIETNSYWGDSYKYSKEITLFSSKKIGNIEFGQGYSFEKMKANFDKFYKLIQQNKNVEYKIFFPPYASIWWKYADEYNCTIDILRFKEYVVSKLINNKNIEIYEFQDIAEITLNLDNYKDMIHYGPMINKEIISLIKEKKYIVKDIDDYNKRIEKLKEQIQTNKTQI